MSSVELQKVKPKLVPQHQNPIFYGLLYVDRKGQKNANLRGGGDPLDIYLRCASLCARSIAYHGYRFRLVTNNKPHIERRLRELGHMQMDVIQEEFDLSVPENLSFRAAHFKLELYKLLGSGRFGEHIGVIDIDSVMTGPIDFPPFSPGVILVYDITDQVLEEFGSGILRFDLERVSGTRMSKCRWFGGEFLFGHAESFRRLAASVFRIWPKYIEHVGDLHHVSDEMPVAAAIFSANLELMDAGRLGFVGRWWTARTNFKQMPFEAVVTRSILHLPSDKNFLANYADIEFSPENFIAQFRRAAGAKLFRRRLFNIAETLLRRKRKYVAHLS
jgi:hypothetical protein